MILGIIIGMFIWQTITMIVYFVKHQDEDSACLCGVGIWCFIIGYIVKPIIKFIKKFKKPLDK